MKLKNSKFIVLILWLALLTTVVIYQTVRIHIYLEDKTIVKTITIKDEYVHYEGRLLRMSAYLKTLNNKNDATRNNK